MGRPEPGDVWRYPYLWRRPHEGGETEGRKLRPTAFVAVVSDERGSTNLFILSITSSPPSRDRLALEVPQMERRRAGLDDRPLWVMLDEYNHDVLERSHYFEPGGRVGAFSSAFHKKVLNAFLQAARKKRIRSVPRN